MIVAPAKAACLQMIVIKKIERRKEITMAKQGGWAGKVLRVDLSTGRISTENTVEKYKDYLGGTGIGYKVIWDEVPTGTKPFDPANKIHLRCRPSGRNGCPLQRTDGDYDALAYLLAEAPGGQRAHGGPFCRLAQVCGV